MSTKLFNIVIIPYWIKDLLESQNLPLSFVKDYSKVREHLTHEHRKLLLMSQELKTMHISSSDLGANCYALMELWNTNTTNSENSEIDSLYKDCKSKLENPVGFLEILGLKDNSEVTSSNLTSENYFEVVDLDGAVGVVIKKGVEHSSISDIYNSVQDMVKLLYIYEAPYKASDHVVFNTYLRLMEKNRIAS